MKKIPIPPKHLSTATKRWWRNVLKTYEFAESELPLLEAAATAWDRANEARQLIEQNGITIIDRFKQVKANPACGVERDSLATYARLVRQLGFAEAEDYESTVRPPRI
jgi:P27 family predicted phage terminase small subunit